MASGDDVQIVIGGAPEIKERILAWPVWEILYGWLSVFVPVRREATAAERGLARENIDLRKTVSSLKHDLDMAEKQLRLRELEVSQLGLLIGYHEARLKAGAEIEAMRLAPK